MDQTTIIVTVSVTALGLIAGALGHAVQPGKAQRILLFLANLSPGNVIGAIRALQGEVNGVLVIRRAVILGASLMHRIGMILLAAMSFTCLLLALDRCGGTAAPVIDNAAVAADVAAYSAEQQDCISGSANLATAQACVASVRARWCGPGGTLAQVGACGDGGVGDASQPLPAAIMKIFGDAGGQ